MTTIKDRTVKDDSVLLVNIINVMCTAHIYKKKSECVHLRMSVPLFLTMCKHDICLLFI